MLFHPPPPTPHTHTKRPKTNHRTTSNIGKIMEQLDLPCTPGRREVGTITLGNSYGPKSPQIDIY